MGEELAITVQKFPVLFDKANREFHRKDVKKNAWKVVAEQMGMEDGECFENIFY